MNQLANPDGASAETQAVIGSILAVLYERTGCDFSRYRPATVYRRILNRMISAGVGTLNEYLQLLQTTEDEGLRLLERVTIKVSRFYRNHGTFEIMRRQLIPELRNACRDRPLRIWSAGCGCGEEAYTLAMLLEETGAAGIIEASDIDPAALAIARVGIYPVDAVSELPVELVERYLEPAAAARGGGHRVRDIVRRRVRFSRHDLTSMQPGPAGGGFDLVCCRNVLIYLRRDIQEQILRRLVQALAPAGCLCLGEAEWPGKSVAASLEPLGRKVHIFRSAKPVSSET